MATHTEGRFASELKPHLERFNQYVLKHILYDHAAPDHLCYKCGSRQEFELIRNLFESDGMSFWNSKVSNRSIAYIRLSPGIETALGMVNYLELQDQKPDGSQKPGFAHIEAYPVGQSYESMVAQLSTTESPTESGHVHHPAHDFRICDHFIFRCARGPLIHRIKREEM